MSLAVLAGAVVGLYSFIADQQASFKALLDNYPPALMAFFGDMGAMFTPAGFLSVELFSFMPVVVGIFAIMTGSGLLAADEENGTLDLLLAHPVSRVRFFAGRLAAYVCALVIILVLAWLGLIIGARGGPLGLSPLELSRPFISVGAVLLLLGTLAMALSMALPSRRSAGMVAGLVLVGSYFASSLGRINDSIKAIARWLPLDYYQGGQAIVELNVGWLVGLLAASAVFALLAAWLFQRRDIRVGGEGAWRLPGLMRRSPA